jgi:glyoxylase-like metal-dependent hydrolase (beta-lactamase superfamily II)
MRPDPAISFFSGDELELPGGLRLLRLGGHFPGATVLHWADGAEGRGALLCGDVLQVVSDRRYVSFMYSYPNLVPLPGHVVERMARRVDELRFDRIYGAWWDRVVERDGAAAVRRSAERYLAALAWEGEELEL